MQKTVAFMLRLIQDNRLRSNTYTPCVNILVQIWNAECTQAMHLRAQTKSDTGVSAWEYTSSMRDFLVICSGILWNILMSVFTVRSCIFFANRVVVSLSNKLFFASFSVFYRIHFGDCAMILHDLIPLCWFHHQTTRCGEGSNPYVVDIYLIFTKRFAS